MFNLKIRIKFYKAKLLYFVQLEDCIKILYKSVSPTLKIFLISVSPPSGSIIFSKFFLNQLHLLFKDSLLAFFLYNIFPYCNFYRFCL